MMFQLGSDNMFATFLKQPGSSTSCMSPFSETFKLSFKLLSVIRVDFFAALLFAFCLSYPVELLIKFTNWSLNRLNKAIKNRKENMMVMTLIVTWSPSEIVLKYVRYSTNGLSLSNRQTLQKITSNSPNIKRKRKKVNLPTLCAPTQLLIHGQWWSYR